MKLPRFRLFDLFVYVAVVAIIAALAKTIWPDDRDGFFYDNQPHLFAFNLFLLVNLSLIGYFGRPKYRPFAIGYCAFGWMFLVFVLHANFGIGGNGAIDERFAMGKAAIGGILYSILAGIVTYYVLPQFVDKQAKK